MALILSMVTTSTTELITRHSLGTFQLSPNQDIECTKEGLFLNAPLSSAYEICVRTHCLKENTPPIRKIFKVPPKELLFEFEATCKLRYKENYVTVLKTCPAQPFCTTIDCTICSANILNPECWPVAAILGSGIVLYLLIAMCYTICYVPVTVGKPFRLLLQGIYDLVQLLLRAIIICACGFTNALRKRRRQQNILEALAILGLSLQGVFSCQMMNVLSHHIKSCTTGERKSCNIGLASVIKLNSFKRDSCLRLQHNGTTIMEVQIEWNRLNLLCQRSSVTHTRDAKLVVIDSKRCAHMGSCKGNKCADINSSSLLWYTWVSCLAGHMLERWCSSPGYTYL
ncbi:unnamed protein product [Nippostrongylus brasiliensis]|uniref:Phlebovirus_G2 domain-containing protein n=1 Tax=Nippostrongylus brasiliensis TaxID=27835 RepID=A0A0N4Y8C5_NIPBR|nr:unnamed protein product [Nippostrongylus brasiliensis]